MAGISGCRDSEARLKELSAEGDPLEKLSSTVDFEMFRPLLEKAVRRSGTSKGGRPPFDPVSMFKALILQVQHNLSAAKMEFMIRDRLSWMRFLGFDLGGPTPDENMIRLFRNKLTETGALQQVMKAFDWQLQKKGYIPMSGQIVDASLVPVPKQRNSPRCAMGARKRRTIPKTCNRSAGPGKSGEHKHLWDVQAAPAISSF